MNDLQIQRISSLPGEKMDSERAEAQNILTDFQKVLKRSIEEVDGLAKEANHSVQEMITGKMDVHQAMVAMEQANISFRLMVQVRNKMMAAYEEIMRMQI
ncbi:MAG: flagellar hook-basal body complex protein FliE [Deltaproteobacteria bacterium]|jgi:flagellar hook-basal body complex protein FliE|nr:flagellar hook-basal body complex protein FliE [Deltaproteobacteria bacterium]